MHLWHMCMHDSAWRRGKKSTFPNRSWSLQNWSAWHGPHKCPKLLVLQDPEQHLTLFMKWRDCMLSLCVEKLKNANMNAVFKAHHDSH